MKLSDLQKRFAAPFSGHQVSWKPAAFNKERTRALMLAHVDARAVTERLNALCPDGWHFELEVVAYEPRCIVKGRLTILGVSREDIGELAEGHIGGLKAAASDALKRCAVHFGIGRYLYELPKVWVNWDDQQGRSLEQPPLPAWAKPEHERSAGSAHVLQAIDQLRYELPEDIQLQREVYKHLREALASLSQKDEASQAA